MEAWRPEVEPAPTITLIVATFGGDDWSRLGDQTARRNERQGFDDVIRVHDRRKTAALHVARNVGAAHAQTGWLCFLDADDDLDSRYVDAMRKELAPGRLLAPAAQTVTNGAYGQIEEHYGRDIRHLNPCVIGTLVERELFLNVGGFLDEPLYEDWSLFLRCVRAGARVHPVPDAVYLARMRQGSRNDQPDSVRRHWYWTIRKAYA